MSVMLFIIRLTGHMGTSFAPARSMGWDMSVMAMSIFWAIIRLASCC